MRALALDGTGFHVAGDAQTLAVSAVAHGIQLLQRDVVALTLLYAGIGQVSEPQHDDRDDDSELSVFAPARVHTREGMLKPMAGDAEK